jgi:hypothetical protein
MDVMSAYGHGGYSSGEYGVGLSICASVSEYGSLDAFLAEMNRFLDAFQSVYNWRPVWDGEPEVYESNIYVYWETSDLIPAYEKGTNAMSYAKREALVKDLVAFHIHRMGLRSGMQLYNSVGKICEYMQYRLLTYDHNYRYGSAFRGEDKRNTPMGVLFFSDLTELYEIRDEYIRSRPVVSIVLVDNYDELTRNMTEAAISGMNARINNTIMKWAQGYHGLLRRLEKNRFLLVFETRDLKKAVAGKFSLLEDIHGITSPAGLEASVSIGLGVDGATFEES